jgi:prophage tail gpP-like protein
MQTLGDAGHGGYLPSTFPDPNVRHRRRVIIAEAGDAGVDVGLQRGAWEAAARYGKSFRLTLTTDSWRDALGALWTPNTTVQVDIPALKLTARTWVISEVSYRRDRDGTHTDLVIMPPAAFQPEPILLAPTFADVPPGGAK